MSDYAPMPDAMVLLLSMPEKQREEVLDLAEASGISHLLMSDAEPTTPTERTTP